MTPDYMKFRLDYVVSGVSIVLLNLDCVVTWSREDGFKTPSILRKTTKFSCAN